jgi:hypothetical protein
MKKLFQSLIVCAMVVLVGVGVAGCLGEGKIDPLKKFEKDFSVQMPTNAIVEYNYRKKGSGWLDPTKGWNYTIFKFSEEPTTILNSLSFVNVPSDFYESLYKIEEIESIPKECFPVWEDEYLLAERYINSSSWFVLYSPNTLKLIACWS